MKRSSPIQGDGRDPPAKYRFYGDQFLLDTVSGNFYRVSPTAGFILRHLIDGETPAELVKVVADRFKIDRSRALRDIEMFTSELRSLGILDNVRA